MKRLRLPVLSNMSLRELDAVYAGLPKIDCKRLCSEYCGPVWGGEIELVRLSRALGREWTVAVNKEVKDGNLDCVALKNGLCTVYQQRPAICRLWGCVEAMRCPHGCEPERWLTDEEAKAIFKALDGIEVSA